MHRPTRMTLSWTGLAADTVALALDPSVRIRSPSRPPHARRTREQCESCLLLIGELDPRLLRFDRVGGHHCLERGRRSRTTATRPRTRVPFSVDPRPHRGGPWGLRRRVRAGRAPQGGGGGDDPTGVGPVAFGHDQVDEPGSSSNRRRFDGGSRAPRVFTWCAPLTRQRDGESMHRPREVNARLGRRYAGGARAGFTRSG